MVEARCWLDGEYVEGTGPSFKLQDPATDETVVEVHCASRQDVDKAVLAGKRAWPKWAKQGPEVRAACLNKWADLLEENAEELGKVAMPNTRKRVIRH
jgi:aldehyde dehydrogenase (NAD+)